MTDRKQALIDLLADIELGTWPGDTYDILGASGHWNAFRAFENGSLDAAKALHEEVLPGWVYGLNFHAYDKRYAFVGDGAVFETDEVYSCTHARAWLIAILEALIAKEDTIND